MGPWVTYAEDRNDFSKIITGSKAAPVALIAQLTVMGSLEPFDWEWTC